MGRRERKRGGFWWVFIGAEVKQRRFLCHGVVRREREKKRANGIMSERGWKKKAGDVRSKKLVQKFQSTLVCVFALGNWNNYSNGIKKLVCPAKQE